jgi:predicted metal-dependent enzyme (double-stranded beta helix superfamily)
VTTATVTRALSVRDLQELVRNLADDREKWVPHIRHDPNQRGVALLMRDEQVEVWVLSWLPGQDTGYHDHGGSAAAICVTQGEIHEERLSFAGPPRTQALQENSLSVVPALHISRVHNAGSVPSVSIHAYSPPLGEVGTYSADSDGLIERRVQPGDHELLP